ncbi:MAG: hypothetical protein D6769_03580 [Methanobacteriota archaeon]|nr:MAG: hypothetical protein D6769_03580 [Euryarchaeota archaeon]
MYPISRMPKFRARAKNTFSKFKELLHTYAASRKYGETWDVFFGPLNEIKKSSKGIAGGILNMAYGDFSGVALGLGNDIIGNSKGLMLGLYKNDFLGNVKGFLLSLSTNIAHSGASGLMLGLVNFADDVVGLQIGLINIRKNAPWYAKAIPVIAIRLPRFKKLRMLKHLPKTRPYITAILNKIKTNEDTVEMFNRLIGTRKLPISTLPLLLSYMEDKRVASPTIDNFCLGNKELIRSLRNVKIETVSSLLGAVERCDDGRVEDIFKQL